MSGFPALEPALTLEIVLGMPLRVGDVASGAPMTCVPVTGGALKSVDGGILAGLVDAECVNGLDTSRLDPSMKFTRLNVKSVWKNKDGALIYLSYEALLRMSPAMILLFTGHPDAKSTELGEIFTTLTFETGDAKLAALEENRFVGSGRMVLSEKGLSAQYNVSRVVAALSANGGDPSGFPTPTWTIEGSLSLMAATQTAHTILSLTAPGVQVVPQADQPALARTINETAAAICKENPTRFSFFAALPTLFDPAAAIAELEYAIDVLGAKGVTFFTRYDPPPGDVSSSGYLGTAAFRPVWKALHERQAAVFVHPTHAGGPNANKLINPLLPGPFLDYPHETARAAMDMLASGTKRDFPGCKVILSHAGGTLPILLFRAVPGIEMISRQRAAAAAAAGAIKEGDASGVLAARDLIADAMTFYFDLALSGSKNVLDTLLRNFPTDRILYGSDNPFAPRPAIEMFKASIDAYEMDAEVRENIYWKNAVKLFPDLAGVKL